MKRTSVSVPTTKSANFAPIKFLCTIYFVQDSHANRFLRQGNNWGWTVREMATCFITFYASYDIIVPIILF